MNLTKLLELTIASRQDIRKTLELEEMIKKAMLLQCAKEKGGSYELNRYKAAKKYIDDAIKNNPHRENMYGAFMENDFQCLCNSYTAIRLSNYIDNLPVAKSPINLKNAFPDYANKHGDYCILNDIVDIALLKLQLKEAIAEEKASNKKGFQSPKRLFKFGKQHFSIGLFLEIVNIMPGKYVFYQHKDNTVSPMVIVCGYSSALILPVKVPENVKGDD